MSKDDDKRPSTSATRLPRKAEEVTFPPTHWEQSVVSKTLAPTTSSVSGEIEVRAKSGALPGGPRPPSELEARNFLNTRFAAAGYKLLFDYAFHAPGVALHLDAFDPELKTGYLYLSHQDADVVSDVGEAEELALRQLDAEGKAHVLIVHDVETTSLEVLERHLDTFLARLHRMRLQQRG